MRRLHNLSSPGSSSGSSPGAFHGLLCAAAGALIAVVAVGCDSSPRGAPSGFGGGPIPWNEPTEENVANTRFGTFEHTNLPPPAGPEAYRLPGMPKQGQTGPATESNGGSGSGATGTQGIGETSQRGLNPESTSQRPVPEGGNLDLRSRKFPRVQ